MTRFPGHSTPRTHGAEPQVWGLSRLTRRSLRRSAAVVAGVCATWALPGPAVGATEIGQILPSGLPVSCGTIPTSWVQRAVGSGNPYVVPPAGGVITSWRSQLVTGGGGTASSVTMVLRVFSGGPNAPTLVPTAESTPQTVTASAAPSYPARVPVSGGELLGLRLGNSADPPACAVQTMDAADKAAFVQPPSQFTGQPESYGPGGKDRLSIAAVVEPDVDGDGFGDETQDGCTTSASRQDDCVDPTANLLKKPKRRTESHKAKFAFSSSEQGSRFECALDRFAFKSCHSPKGLRGLDAGKHVFSVLAIDANGNESKPVAFRWRVIEG